MLTCVSTCLNSGNKIKKQIKKYFIKSLNCDVRKQTPLINLTTKGQTKN